MEGKSHDGAAFSGSEYPHPSQPPAYPGPPPSQYPHPGVYPHPGGPTIVQQPGTGVTLVNPGMGGATVVSGGVATVVLPVAMGSKPAVLRCRSCQAEIVTRVELKSTIRTHLMAALLCLLGCWCCVCIPYCVDSCQNAEHYCPNCSAYIGSSIN